MNDWCYRPQFQRNDRVVSTIYHHPPIEPGVSGTILTPRIGNLYVVQLPTGELHKWFASFELERVNMEFNNNCEYFYPGSMAKILTNEGHPPFITPGMTVKIVRGFHHVPYYDLMLDSGEYHRWLAEFEITSLESVS